MGLGKIIWSLKYNHYHAGGWGYYFEFKIKRIIGIISLICRWALLNNNKDFKYGGSWRRSPAKCALVSVITNNFTNNLKSQISRLPKYLYVSSSLWTEETTIISEGVVFRWVRRFKLNRWEAKSACRAGADKI